jgi:hypothetical protein
MGRRVSRERPIIFRRSLFCSSNNNSPHGTQIIFVCIIFHCALVCSCIELTPLNPNSQAGQFNNDRNLNLGTLDRSHEGTDFLTAISSRKPNSFRGDRLSTVGTLRAANNQQQQQQQQRASIGSSGNYDRLALINDAKKQDDILSTDCFAKRNQVLKRQSQTNAVTPASARASSPATSTMQPLAGFQRLRPKIDAHGGGGGSGLGSAQPSIVLNMTMANNFDGEHLPRCRQDGTYDPVQCHKIGYCWCVNKYGQAIKNSAVRSGEEPECEPSMYESESNNQLVVAGISAHRIKNILKSGGSAFDSSTPNGNINFEATEPTTLSSDAATGDGHQQVEAHGGRLSGSGHEPVMPLIPNDCRNSRENAKNRAETQVNDSIWVPECDINDEKLYAEQQCHKSRVCWCVDQTTGLPLRASEQLSSRPIIHNCTEIKKILGITSKPHATAGSGKLGQQDATTTTTGAFYQGSSEYCDASKRADFVISLNNQFRHQISEYLRQNASSLIPADLGSTNPYQVSELQVAKWKFSIMDRDSDGKIGDREWSKFKNNFKLVDKAAELDNPFKQQKSPYFSLTPLLIVRSQRKCWRDFLEFCGNGELVDESISLSMWLSCTELPPKSITDEQTSRSSISTSENTYALSREAAIVRSQKKNPFLGILKPD